MVYSIERFQKYSWHVEYFVVCGLLAANFMAEVPGPGVLQPRPQHGQGGGGGGAGVLRPLAVGRQGGGGAGVLLSPVMGGQGGVVPGPGVLLLGLGVVVRVELVRAVAAVPGLLVAGQVGGVVQVRIVRGGRVVRRGRHQLGGQRPGQPGLLRQV